LTLTMARLPGWPTTSRHGQASHPLLWLLRKPRQGLSAGEGSIGRPGRAGPRQETLFAELAAAHQTRPTRSSCRGCGGPLKIVAYITDEISIKRILDHLGLSPPGQEEPAPTPEVVRAPVDDEGHEILAG